MSTDTAPVFVGSHASPQIRATHRLRNVANTAAYLLPHIHKLSSTTPNLKLLDIGCGPGTISVDFARVLNSIGKGGTVTAVDYAPEPVEETANLAKAEGLTNVYTRVADIHALPFEDDTFDIVHVSQVLQHLSDPVHGLQEMRRVVKSNGGVVAARETAWYTAYPDLRGIDMYWRVFQQVAKMRGGHPHPGSYLHVWAKQAGFTIDQITKSAGNWCYSTDEEREAWATANIGRAQASGDGFGNVALKNEFCTADDLQVMRDDWAKWMKDEDGWFAFWQGEILCWK